MIIKKAFAYLLIPAFILSLSCAQIQTNVRTEEIPIPDAKVVNPKASERKIEVSANWEKENLIDIKARSYSKCWNEVTDKYHVYKITERKISNKKNYIEGLILGGVLGSSLFIGTAIWQKQPAYFLALLPWPAIGIIDAFRATDSKEELPIKQSTNQKDFVPVCQDQTFEGMCNVSVGSDIFQVILKNGNAKFNLEPQMSSLMNSFSNKSPEEATALWTNISNNFSGIKISCGNEIFTMKLNDFTVGKIRQQVGDLYLKRGKDRENHSNYSDALQDYIYAQAYGLPNLKLHIGEMYFKRGKDRENRSDYPGALEDYTQAQAYGYSDAQSHAYRIKENAIISSKTWEQAVGIAFKQEDSFWEFKCISDTKAGLPSQPGEFVCLSAEVWQVNSENSFLARTDLLWRYDNFKEWQDFWGTIVNKNMPLYEGKYFFIAKFKGDRSYIMPLGVRRTIPEYQIYYITTVKSQRVRSFSPE